MRSSIGVLLVGSLFLSAPERGQADDREAALKILDAAIQAAGGEGRLAKARLMSRTARGTIYNAGKEISFSTQLLFAPPDRLRDAIEVEVNNKKMQVTRVVNGDKGWTSAGGATLDIGSVELQELREELYYLWLTTLLPLKDPAFTLAPLPETKINGQAAVGLKISRKEHEDVKLYFGRDSGLLVKAARRAQVTGIPVDKEYLYSEPRDFDGVKLPARQLEKIAGTKSFELTITRVEFPARAEDSAFAKP
jgi:hypothetical protein